MIDISDPTSPSIAGSHDTPGFAWDVAISGDYAYVADCPTGLRVIDISDPTSPSLAGNFDTPGYIHTIAVSGDYAYVADASSGLQVIDISDPASPSLAGSYDTAGSATGVAIAGDYAYVADVGLQVIDISDPTNPSIAGNYDTPGAALDIAVSGDYAYLTDFYDLRVVDISDPTSPSYAGHITVGSAYGVAVSGDFAYIANAASGLMVVQVYQRMVNLSKNTGRSVQINSSSDDILAVKLSSTQTDSIKWEVSANGGTDWQQMLPDACWNMITVPGNDLRWRSTHVYSQALVNPTCSGLVINWISALPFIDPIMDIPNDQGRQVSISWIRSSYDYVGSSTPITEYAIYRRIDYDLSMSPEPEGPGTDGNDVLTQRDGLAPCSHTPRETGIFSRLCRRDARIHTRRSFRHSPIRRSQRGCTTRPSLSARGR